MVTVFNQLPVMVGVTGTNAGAWVTPVDQKATTAAVEVINQIEWLTLN